MGAVFGELGGGEIDGDFAVREGKTGVGKGKTDTLAGFRDGFIGHTDNIKGGEAVAGGSFDFNKMAVIALGNGGIYFCDHMLPRLTLFDKKLQPLNSENGRFCGFRLCSCDFHNIQKMEWIEASVIVCDLN